MLRSSILRVTNYFLAYLYGTYLTCCNLWHKTPPRLYMNFELWLSQSLSGFFGHHLPFNQHLGQKAYKTIHFTNLPKAWSEMRYTVAAQIILKKKILLVSEKCVGVLPGDALGTRFDSEIKVHSMYDLYSCRNMYVSEILVVNTGSIHFVCVCLNTRLLMWHSCLCCYRIGKLLSIDHHTAYWGLSISNSTIWNRSCLTI